MKVIIPPEAKSAARELAKKFIEQGYKPVGLYQYPKHYVMRLEDPELKKGKIIRPFCEKNGEWQMGRPDYHPRPLPLYRVKDAIALADRESPALPIFIVEGEKKVDALIEMGVPATTSGSCSSAKGADWTSLQARIVCIWPDNDAPGFEYADEVAEILAREGCIVRAVNVGELNLPDSGDVIDWIATNPTATAQSVYDLPCWGVAESSSAEVQEPSENAPIPLERQITASWPEGALPESFESMARGLATALGVPVEMTGPLTLAFISIACRGRYRVCRTSDHQEPVNIWTCILMESGNRKSAVTSKLKAPLTAWEQRRAEEMTPKILAASVDLSIAEQKLVALKKQIAKPGTEMAEVSKMRDDILEIQENLPVVPVPPRLFTTDSTPEKLVALMSQHGERMAMVSDEGTFFQTMSGMYSSSGQTNIDAALQSWDGGEVRQDRLGRESQLLSNPLTTVAIACQPTVLEQLKKKEEMRGRGFIGRLLFAIPESMVGRRKLGVAELPAAVIAEYDRAITNILDTRFLDDEEIGIIGIEEDALRYYEHEFFDVVESEMMPDGKLFYAKDWGSKIQGQVLRIAGLLHVAKYHDNQPQLINISLETMKNAVRIAEFYIDHALVALDLLKRDPVRTDAKHLLEWATGRNEKTFTCRDVQRANSRRFENVKQIEQAAEILIEHGYLSRELKSAGKRGGRPAWIYSLIG